MYKCYEDIGWGQKNFDIAIFNAGWYNFACENIYIFLIWFDIVKRNDMNVSYNKLWKLIIDKNMNKGDLRKLTGIGTNTLAKLSKNQPVSMEVLLKMCEKLDCDISDICEFIKIGEQTL